MYLFLPTPALAPVGGLTPSPTSGSRSRGGCYTKRHKADINMLFDGGMWAGQDVGMFEHNAPSRRYYARFL